MSNPTVNGGHTNFKTRYVGSIRPDPVSVVRCLPEEVTDILANVFVAQAAPDMLDRGVGAVETVMHVVVGGVRAEKCPSTVGDSLARSDACIGERLGEVSELCSSYVPFFGNGEVDVVGGLSWLPHSLARPRPRSPPALRGFSPISEWSRQSGTENGMGHYGRGQRLRCLSIQLPATEADVQ